MNQKSSKKETEAKKTTKTARAQTAKTNRAKKKEEGWFSKNKSLLLYMV